MGITEVAQELRSLGNVPTLSHLWEEVMQVESQQLLNMAGLGHLLAPWPLI